MRRLSFFLILCTLLAHATQQSNNFAKWRNLPSSQLRQMGSDYAELKHMPDSALLCFSIVTSRTSGTPDVEERHHIVGSYNGKWFVYFFSYFDYASSYECLMRAEELSDLYGINKCRVYLNFGCMYQTLAEQNYDPKLYQRAYDYYLKSIEEAQKNDNFVVGCNSVSNLISVAAALGKLDSIHDEFEYLRKMGPKADGIHYDYTIKLYDGMLAMQKGDYAQALQVFEHQLSDTDESPQNVRYRFLCFINIAKSYSQMGKNREAIENAKEALSIGQKYDIKDAKIEAYHDLVTYSQKANRIDQTEEYRNQYFRIKDTLLNYHQLASVNKMQFLGEMKKIDEKMLKIQHTSQMKTGIIAVVALIALIVTAFLMLMRRKNHALEENNRSLYQRNVEILEAEAKERQQRHEMEQMLAKLPTATKPERYKNSTLDESDKAELISRIKEVLEEHTDEVCTKGFTLDRLAELAGASYKHVSQVINEIPGNNYNTLINDYRIREACKRINDIEQYGNLTIEAIANGVGFKSVNAFRAAFKRVTGLAPSEYQRQARKQGK